MVELLSEASQELPNWLESLAYEARTSYPKRRGGGGGNRYVWVSLSTTVGVVFTVAVVFIVVVVSTVL